MDAKIKILSKHDSGVRHYSNGIHYIRKDDALKAMQEYHKQELEKSMPSEECICKCSDVIRIKYPLTNIAHHLPYNICHYCGKAVITEYGKQSLQPK